MKKTVTRRIRLIKARGYWQATEGAYTTGWFESRKEALQHLKPTREAVDEANLKSERRRLELGV